jgi:selenocysteine lyase/cysteine desulfurase
MEETDYLAFRRGFPIFQSRVYLNSCSQGALSDSVEGALQDYIESWHRRGSPWDRWMEVQEELRGEFAALIGAAADEIAISFSASTAIYAIASALDYSDRNRVVMGELEFPTQCHVWLAQQKRGAEITWVPSRNGTNTPEDYRSHLDGKSAIVPTTHVCFRNGFRNDAAGIARIAHEAGAYFLLDDYQNCGCRPTDVGRTGADFYISGALKYLLGPSGVAFLYVRRELIENLHPTLTGWFAQRSPFSFDIKNHEPADSANRFQTGTPPVPSIYAALAGIRLLRQFGLHNVEKRIAQLTRLLIAGVQKRGWKLKTPEGSGGPLVVIAASSKEDAAMAVNDLERMGIIVSSRDSGVRISFHAYNSPADVEAVLTGLDKIW